jgi:hypothetical protein
VLVTFAIIGACAAAVMVARPCFAAGRGHGASESRLNHDRQRLDWLWQAKLFAERARQSVKREHNAEDENTDQEEESFKLVTSLRALLPLCVLSYLPRVSH